MYKKYRETKLLKQEKSLSQVKPAVIPKKKPEWDFSMSDPDKYKLSQAEMVQRKFAYISKHQNEAKEQWLCTQEKLKNGVKDEETEKIMETALMAKNLLGKKKKTLQKREKSLVLHHVHKNSNFIASDSSFTLRENEEQKPGNLLEKIEKNLESTRNFIKKMEKCKETINEPAKMLRKLEKIKEETKKEQEALPKPTQEHVISEEVMPYFHSLNKIEDTIRFLEGHIKDSKENPGFLLNSQQIPSFLSPETKVPSQKIENIENLSTVSKNMKTFFLSPDNPLAFTPKEVYDEEEKEEEPFRKNENKNFFEESLKKTTRNEDERENAPISFDVTAKSKSFDEELDNQKDSLLFLNNLIKNDDIPIPKLNPELFFKNVESCDGNDSDKENWPENSGNAKQDEKYNELKPKIIFSEIEGKKLKKAHQVDDEEENMMEKIKSMLENTKQDLTKMSQISFDFPNYQIVGSQLQNSQNNSSIFQGLKTQKNGYFFENVSGAKKNEKMINVEPVSKTLSSNFNVKVNNPGQNNTKKTGQNMIEMDEDEMPMPRRLNVVKAEERKFENLSNKMFKKTSGESLNIRSFLK